MEEEKTISLEELIELNESIEIKGETLGILNFRRIYIDDYLFIDNCLNEELDQELFCKQFLINKICNPILTLDDFNDVDENEIRLILKKYVEVENLEDYFDFNNSKDIFIIFKEGMESYRNHVNSIINSIINSFNFHERLTSYLYKLTLFWDNFQINYQIPSLDAQKCLKKYNWFISPNMYIPIVYEIMEVCNSSSEHKQKEINNIFVNYFLENDYKKLDGMVDKWSTNPLFKRRIKIIKDCVNIMKVSGNDINYSNLVVPTLIAQIDGIQKEFMKLNGFQITRYGFIDSEGNKIDKNNYFRKLTSDNEFFDSMNDFFLDVLFQTANPGEKCKSLHFSRHKILHGEITNYGQKVFTIRCFMILDFLSELMFINDEE